MLQAQHAVCVQLDHIQRVLVVKQVVRSVEATLLLRVRQQVAQERPAVIQIALIKIKCIHGQQQVGQMVHHPMYVKCQVVAVDHTIQRLVTEHVRTVLTDHIGRTTIIR